MFGTPGIVIVFLVHTRGICAAVAVVGVLVGNSDEIGHPGKVTSTASFQKCDPSNLGVSSFCDLETSNLNPTMWAEEARNTFNKAVGKIPHYLLLGPDNKTIHSNKRYHFANKAQMEKFVFQAQVAGNMTYNSFEKDIAMVKFYFEKGRVIQFQRKASNNWFNFMSQVGGNAGLGVGFSIISAMEIIYWITIRIIQNYIAHGKKKKRASKNLT